MGIRSQGAVQRWILKGLLLIGFCRRTSDLCWTCPALPSAILAEISMGNSSPGSLLTR